MSEILNETIVAEATPLKEENKADSSEKVLDFKFFKCCSASLKRFSVLLFVINLFLSICLLGAALVVLGVYIGVEMLTLLALPVVTVFVIMIIIARFISAVVYGFAEIVEKHEKN